ncbi:Ovate domain-containing protein [Cephalotus follicularis]|uniref:Transcription repressor n=1 Tax=Cephalotus follicularis TaxID=3775 RepID=A0A1Q3AN93_CEPFO|nr:Ovate domain-containing protein [Cephalotus follicularis]
MGKKLKPPFLVSKNNTQAKSSWPWLSCYHQRVLSYRANVNNVFKTINPPYITIDNIETTESWFINSSESASFSTASDDSGGDSTETVIKGIRSSERLLFEPGETSSILEEAKTSGFPFKASVVLSMESQDPCVDFRKSMEEMVDAHRLKDWDGLEELLCWYLRVNVKSNRGIFFCESLCFFYRS